MIQPSRIYPAAIKEIQPKFIAKIRPIYYNAVDTFHNNWKTIHDVPDNPYRQDQLIELTETISDTELLFTASHDPKWTSERDVYSNAFVMYSAKTYNLYLFSFYYPNGIGVATSDGTLTITMHNPAYSISMV